MKLLLDISQILRITLYHWLCWNELKHVLGKTSKVGFLFFLSFYHSALHCMALMYLTLSTIQHCCASFEWFCCSALLWCNVLNLPYCTAVLYCTAVYVAALHNIEYFVAKNRFFHLLRWKEKMLKLPVRRCALCRLNWLKVKGGKCALYNTKTAKPIFYDFLKMNIFSRWTFSSTTNKF